uniref:Uncharacterized protein n=1 Tax=Rhizophora mucronata TaxID=61149 RepID=A0A2P2MZ89_RHIMU
MSKRIDGLSCVYSIQFEVSLLANPWFLMSNLSAYFNGQGKSIDCNKRVDIR